jgi:hypothetical protein
MKLTPTNLKRKGLLHLPIQEKLHGTGTENKFEGKSWLTTVQSTGKLKCSNSCLTNKN